MAFYTTYSDVLLRADIESHRGGETGPLSRTDRRRVVQDRWRTLHFQFGQAYGDGYGMGFEVVTQGTTGQLVPLPPNFLRLVFFERSDRRDEGNRRGRLPQRTTHEEALRHGWLRRGVDPGGLGRYLIEGPGEEWDVGLGQYVVYPQRLRLFPELAAGQTIDLGYRIQAPTFGDPTDDNDDVVQVDVIAEPAFAWLANELRIVMASREEAQELARARVRAQEVAEMVRDLHGLQDDGVIDVRAFATPELDGAGY